AAAFACGAVGRRRRPVDQRARSPSLERGAARRHNRRGRRASTTGALDDGTPLDYAWGVRVFRVGGNRVESHGGSWEGATAKLVRLPDLGVSFAALAHDGSVERMAALSSSLQDELLGGTTL